MSTIRSLCKHTWKFMIYTILTKKRRLRPDIWTETFYQAKSIENMMRTAWNIKAICQQNTSKTLDSLLSLTGKKVKYVGAFLIFD